MILLDLIRIMNACRYSPFWHYLLVFTSSINLNLTLNSLLVTHQMTLSIYWKHWRSHEQRRVDSRLTNLYKLRNHLFAIDENKYLQRGTGRRDHQYDYRQLRADKDYTRFSFFPRTVIQCPPTLTSKLPGRVARYLQGPGRENRALQTKLIIQHFFYLFAFLLLYFIPTNMASGKKLSCETQLIQFIQDLSDTLNEKGQTDIIVMDFTKALIR